MGISTAKLPAQSMSKPKVQNYYFNNQEVERLLTEYVKGGCVDVKLRDKIMGHAEELIRQVIRTHNLHNVYGGGDDASFDDLFQTAYCVAADSMVFTNYGVVRIEECVGADFIGPCKIKIYGINGPNYTSKYLKRPLTNVLHIITKFGYNIQATAEHPFLVLTTDGPKWVNASQLRIGDLLAIQCGQHYFNPKNAKIAFIPTTKGGTTTMWNPPPAMTDELAYLIGLIISEGSIERTRIHVYNSSNEVKLFMNNNDLKLPIKDEGGGHYAINCMRFVEFLANMGLRHGIYAFNKFIPSFMMRCPKQIVVSLLRGMFDGDGHSSRFDGGIGYTSTSKMLIDQLRILLLNFGIVTHTHVSRRKEVIFNKGKKNERRSQVLPSYQLRCSSVDSDKFYNLIGFCIKRKQDKKQHLTSNLLVSLPSICVEKLKALFQKTGKSKRWFIQHFGLTLRFLLNQKWLSFKMVSRILEGFKNWRMEPEYKFIADRLNEHNNIKWFPIVSIIDGKAPVINLKVPKTETFTANGFITHNCQIESTLYKFDYATGHAKIFNFWSQVAKTNVLAYIKKESRDRKNSPSYRTYLDAPRRDAPILDRFISEASEMFKYNNDARIVLDAIKWLYENDERPYEGLIGKLVMRTNLPRTKISDTLREMKLRCFEYTDAPVNSHHSRRGGRNKQYHDFEAQD